MNSDDPEYPRYLERNRLQSDRKDALRLVNSIFDDRERYFEARNDIDQETALKFVEIGQEVARMAVGFDIPRIALRHDHPKSRDALKMVLRTFRSMMLMNLDPGDWSTTITTDSIDGWLNDLHWLDKGVSSPVFEPRPLTGAPPNRVNQETKITISLWLAYLDGLLDRRKVRVKTKIGWLAQHFVGYEDSTIRGLSQYAKKQGEGGWLQYCHKMGQDGEWPHDLAGPNPHVRELWEADFHVRWEALGDDWELKDNGFNAASQIKWREILKAEVERFLTETRHISD